MNKTTDFGPQTTGGPEEQGGCVMVGNLSKHLAVSETPQVGEKQRRRRRSLVENFVIGQRKGNLIFDANFESGNLGRVDCVSPTEYDLFVRPDTCNLKYRLWFYFSVENVSQNQRVIFNMVNFSKKKSLYTSGMSPVVKTTSRPTWQRIPSSHVNYYRSKLHDDRLILSFAFVFDREDERYHFAYCFPYSYSDLQAYLGAIESRNLSYFRRDLLGLTIIKRKLGIQANCATGDSRSLVCFTCVTIVRVYVQQKRRLDLLTVTDLQNVSLAEKQRIVFITARVHPGETPASYICQGLIDFLVSEEAEAQELRKRYVFKIVPMLNPDGVALGNYRCSLMGFDLNRHWQLPSSWAHPTVHATKNLLLQYNNNPIYSNYRCSLMGFDLNRHWQLPFSWAHPTVHATNNLLLQYSNIPQMDLVAYIDVHAHSTKMNSFFYGNVFSRDPKRCDRQLILPSLLAQFSKDFSLKHTAFNTDLNKSGTSRRTLAASLNVKCLCYTLEVSFYCFTNATVINGNGSMVFPYTTDLYMQLGGNLARAMLQFSNVESGLRSAPTLDRPFSTFVPEKTTTEPADSKKNKVVLPQKCSKSVVD